MITECASTKSVSLNATIVMDRYVSISDVIIRRVPMRHVDAMASTTKRMVAPFAGARKGQDRRLGIARRSTDKKTAPVAGRGFH